MENPADIHTKSLPWHKAHVHVEPLLFWKGATSVKTIDSLSLSGPIRGGPTLQPQISLRSVLPSYQITIPT